jgi:restriction system protein
MAGYATLADFHDGVYECDYVSPWSKSAHNADAQVMIVGHDWASDKWMAGPIDEESAQQGYSRRFITNKNLFALLERHLALSFADVFATNAFPFIKRGNSQGSIKSIDMKCAAQQFLLPQIEIVQPLIVICLGKATFNAVRAASGLPRIANLDKAIESSFPLGGAEIYAVAHTGSMRTNQRNAKNRVQVDADWELLRVRWDKLRANRP